jgi:hypothetical protein
MKDGRSGSRSTTPRQALPDWESDDQAGKQSSGAIHDDIDRRVQALLTGLVPASVASAWLQGQKEIRVAPTGRTATPPRREPYG